MRLTVVGCSGSFAGPESAASCYLLQAPYEGRTFSLVVDLGNGALGSLQRHVDLADVDSVVLSHLHVDHCIDVTSYQVVRSYQPGGAMPVLPVYGPRGTAARLVAAAGNTDEAELSKVFMFTDLSAHEPVALGPFSVTPALVNHPVETFALRFEQGGRSLVYSADTGLARSLVDLASGADLLLCEASFLEGANPPDLHLTGRQAAEHARDAEVGQLLLTHIPPWHDPHQVLAEARPAFSGPIDLALPGATHHL